MSVVYPTNVPAPEPEPEPSVVQRVTGFAQRHLVLAGLFLLGLALLIGWAIHRLRGGASAASGGTVSQPIGGAPSGGGPSPTGGAQTFGTVRASGVYPTWDPLHSGVPIRSSPDGQSQILDYAAWGSTLSLGPQVGGAKNNQDPLTGPVSSQWWTVLTSNGQTGYVSAADLASVSTGGSQGIGSGGDPFLEGHNLVNFPSVYQQNHVVQEEHGG